MTETEPVQAGSARGAIAALVEARRNDKHFLRLLEDNLARHRRLLDLLGEDGS